MIKWVFLIDNALLVREFSKLIHEEAMEGEYSLSSIPDLKERPFADVEESYLRVFRELAFTDGI